MQANPPMALIAGAGAGLGQSLCRRFESGGYHVVGLGRTEPEATSGAFHALDLADEAKSGAVIRDLIGEHGAPKVVIHNTAELVISPLVETALDDYRRCWSSMVQSAIVLAQGVMPAMKEAGGGSFLVSGATASLRGGARFSAFASAKFALRGLTQSLAREYQAEGIHVAHVILDGIIDTARSRDLHDLDPAKMLDPADIAEAYWQLAHQPKSTWTHELDLRPASERF